MKTNILTGVAAAAIAAAGIVAGAMVPRPLCEDGTVTGARFTAPRQEAVTVTMHCAAGAWVINPPTEGHE